MRGPLAKRRRKLAAEFADLALLGGSTANISASLLEYDAVPRGRASVWAEVSRPDGALDVVALAAGPGDRYMRNYGLGFPGVYIIRVRARGETMHGTAFEHEQTLTAVAVPGGDRWSPDDPKRDPICELLNCLHRTGVINDEFIRRLKELGIDLPSRLKCFERKCRRTAGTIEIRSNSSAKKERGRRDERLGKKQREILSKVVY